MTATSCGARIGAARWPDRGAVDVGDVLACVHVRARAPARWLLAETLTRAWRAGAGPGAGRLTVDIDSFVGEVCGHRKQGAGFGYTGKRGYHPIVASRAETGEVLHLRLRKGSANTQRGILRFCDELIARVTRAGAAPKLFASRLGVLEHQGV